MDKLHHCNQVAKGDMVRFFVNQQAKKANRYHMGEVVRVSGQFVEIKGPKFKSMRLTKGLVEVVKPVPTKYRMEQLFNLAEKKSGQKKTKRKTTRTIGGMTFQY
jgi:hypothetical protein